MSNETTPAARPGWQTSEFWLALPVVLTACVVVVIQAIRGQIDLTVAVAGLGGALTAATYAVSRARAKNGAAAGAAGAGETEDEGSSQR